MSQFLEGTDGFPVEPCLDVNRINTCIPAPAPKTSD